MKHKKEENRYTCNEYREEMILVALRIKLQQADLGDEERQCLLQEIEELEKKMGM